ncbi:hypothetical protein BDP81DRAFT_473074 [Colletotrichum phormii]|uniref:Hydrophobin n=1 Tax=Colletotrichum phormii TaxID=359342 RepID=A0AAI9ZQA3_9PEZI|nr:uncharacterized protein BDP81DRAFT_473074 [Colletotrichum phormii]KAK1634844.1 hypothetical protein BDP81DRAFT_473074 [Colletotrichum phormii]
MMRTQLRMTKVTHSLIYHHTRSHKSKHSTPALPNEVHRHHRRRLHNRSLSQAKNLQLTPFTAKQQTASNAPAQSTRPPNKGRNEPSGSLTANLTQVACKSGNIDGALKGNQKCCISNNKGAFGAACTAAKFPPQFASGFKATFQPC